MKSKQYKRKNYILIIILTIILMLVGFFVYAKKNKNQTQPNASTTPTATISPSPSASPTEPTKEQISLYQVPILMYHYIRVVTDPNDTLGADLSVTPTNFEKQMKWLKDNGYQTVNLDYFLNPYSLPFKPVIVTFDDGYEDAYTNALPILNKYNFTATFYIITSKVGTPEYLNWQQIIDMNNQKMIIGSHTINHLNLASLSGDSLTKEVTNSKKTIEEKINKTVNDFCYPAGKYNDQTITAVKNASYLTATTVKSGIANQDSNKFELPRLRIKNDTNFQSILK